jgi:hypothetical protein
MALQESLSKIQEYNAAIELPHSGLLGIKAFLKERPSGAVAERLQQTLELCTQAELALLGDETAARRDIHFYVAMRTLFPQEFEREGFRLLLQELQKHLTSLLKYLRQDPSAAAPPRDDLVGLTAKLEDLAERIRHRIPRDAHIASIVGGAYAGPNIAR